MLARVFPRRISLLFPRQQNGIRCKLRLSSVSQETKAITRRFLNPSSSSSLWIRCLWKSTCVWHRPSSTHVSSERQLVYEGPLSRSVQLVKVFSLTTALATIIATPILVVYGKQSIPLAGKFAIGATVMLAGTSTTFLLHWVTKVYVHRMFYNAATERFTVETMSVLARRKETEFSLDEIRIAKEPSAFTTFQANGKKYFLHTDLIEAQQILQFVRENRS